MTTLAELRLDRGLTQTQLATLANLHQVHISRLEAGKNKPNRKTLERLATGLGLSVDDVSDLFEDRPVSAPRFDLVPPRAIAKLATLLSTLAIEEQDEDWWHDVPEPEHLSGALQHVYAYLESGQEEDLAYAACLLLFVLGVRE